HHRQLHAAEELITCLKCGDGTDEGSYDDRERHRVDANVAHLPNGFDAVRAPVRQRAHDVRREVPALADPGEWAADPVEEPHSGTHADEEREPDYTEHDTGQPGSELRGEKPLSTNCFRQLNQHQEYDCRGEAHAHAVGGTPSLRARCKWCAEKKDYETRDRDRDLEHSLHTQLVHVRARPLHRMNESPQLGVVHLRRRLGRCGELFWFLGKLLVV